VHRQSKKEITFRKNNTNTAVLEYSKKSSIEIQQVKTQYKNIRAGIMCQRV